MTTTLREKLVQRLGVVEETTHGDLILKALELRVQRLAPEVLGGDEAAVLELAEVEAEIAQHKRRQELDGLAAVEMASRVRIAAEEEAQRLRDAAGEAKVEVEAERAREVAKVDRTIKTLAVSLAKIRDLDTQVQVLGPQHDPATKSWNYPRAIEAVRNVLSYDLYQVGITDVHYMSGPRPSLGVAPAKKPKAKVRESE